MRLVDPRLRLLFVPLVVGLLLVVPGLAHAAGSPHWHLSVFGESTNFDPASSEDTYLIDITNAGDGATKAGETTVIVDALPEGVEATGAQLLVYAGSPSTHSCSTSPVPRCEYRGALPPGAPMEMIVHVRAQAGAVGPLIDTASVSGGAAGTVSATSSPNGVSPEAPPFGWQGLAVAAANVDQNPYTTAGGHPYTLTVSGSFNNKVSPIHEKDVPGQPLYFPIEEPRYVTVDLPPGVVGDPNAIPQCTLAEFWTSECSPNAQVGTATITYNLEENRTDSYTVERTDLYNVAPEPGSAANLGYEAGGGVPFILSSTVANGGDYSILTTEEAPGLLVTSFSVELWGEPADPSHNGLRGKDCFGSYGKKTGAETTFCLLLTPDTTTVERKPFLRLPTSCPGGSLTATGSVDSWEVPSVYATTEAHMLSAVACNAVPFKPTIQARPTTNQPDAPSGLEFDLHLPQNETPEGIGTADLRDALVTLPAGLRLNPSSANGLSACTEAEVGYKAGTSHPYEFSPGPADCPAASKLGTVEIDTPLLGHPLGNPHGPLGDVGAVYLAKPHENPFGSLLALYAVVDDPLSGVIVKLAGKVEADPQTGQLTTRFEENPQQPFEDFKLHLFGGSQGALRTPSVCGAYKSTSALTPWSAPESGPPAEPADEFAIAGSCAGAEATEPNSPSFDAGTESPQAGQFSPFSFKLVRQDGSQELSRIETVLPPGLTGKLAGVAECPDSAIVQARSREHDGGGAEEQAHPSCAGASEVGSVDVAAGAGPDPYHTSGHAYLAGPYQGAPLSLVVMTPAVAGPFDLGNVVVRTALYVDPETAQITAKSDPIPRIIDGIPLDLRSITLRMDRPGFTLNPTSCDAMSIGGSATSTLGQVASLSQPFQAAGCREFGFEPQLSLRLKGGTRRAQFPSLIATLTMPQPGTRRTVPCEKAKKGKKKARCHVTVKRQADIAAAQVTLPHSAFLQQGHIKKTCGRPELASHTCPAASIYGHAQAITPLLDHPLEGPVYLATGFGYKLPALVADLGGQIEVLLKGKVDTGRENGIRNTFEVVPDAPVTRFTLHMFGGKKGLIVNSENLCAKHAKRKALAEFTGQNGMVHDTEPVVANSCKKHKGKGHGKHGKNHTRRPRASLIGRPAAG